MFQSLYTNLTGIRAYQQSLEQVSNNISNLNTAAYKGAHAAFSDLIYREIYDRRMHAAPDAGALEPQLGKGTRVSAQTSEFAQGTLSQSGRALDLAIEGEGFFRVVKPDDTVAYTRNGSFYLDAAGNIVTAGGDFLDVPFNLAGLMGEADGEERPLGSLVITGDGMAYREVEGEEREELGQIQLFKFVNKDGLVSDRGGQYMEAETSGAPLAGVPGEEGFGEIRQKYLELSNVNLSEEMVHMIVMQRALQSNIRALMTSDELWTLTLQGKS